ncbi:MAG: isochorismate synthase [Actinobacteria bacterium]|nr:MAG: isochorismate synthase [Actinomycetota bacterium]
MAPVSLIPQSAIDRLRALPRGDRFRFLDTPADIDPLGLVRSGAHLFGQAFFVATPGGARFGGLGTAWKATASGGDRLRALRDRIRDLDLPAGERVMVGFSFSDAGPLAEHWGGFGAADAVLPIVAAEHGPEGTILRLALPPGSDPEALANLLQSLRPAPDPLPLDLGDHVIESHPHVSEWRHRVAEAVAAIRAGALEKVVLSRSVVVRSTVPVGGFDVLHQLAGAYPGCYAFGWGVGDAVFIGASPELLLEMRGDRFLSNPLAGSAARGEGELEDRALGESLLASEKDRVEHSLVVDDVAARLRPHAMVMEVPVAPTLRRVATVQHLSTEISGTFHPGTHLLDVVADMHPTPAVGGTPRLEAAGIIDKAEDIDRGWYTGGIGWVGPGSDGLIALALRCGLVRGATAHLYAGAGIVADSDPDQELLETRLKLRPLLELLASG